MRPFVHDDFLLQSPLAGDLYHRVARDPADRRLPLPPAAPADRVRPPLPLADGDLARRRPLQVARHARGRRARALLHRRRVRLGEVRGLGARRCPTRCATRSTTGRTWSCGARSASRRCSPPPPRARSSTARTRSCAEPASPRSACSRASGSRSSARPTTPRTRWSSTQALARRPDPATRVYPTWRPDRALDVDDPEALERAGSDGWSRRAAARSRASRRTWRRSTRGTRRSTTLGCRASDHGLETVFAEPCADAHGGGRLRLRARRQPSGAWRRARGCKSALLHRLALMDHERGWVQQFHLGALRDNNTRLRRTLGRDCGADSIGDFEQARPLARFLDRLDNDDRLTRTILYNSNPRDNELFASHDRQLPGRHDARARCSTAPPGGSSTSCRAWSASSTRCRTWACSRSSSAW